MPTKSVSNEDILGLLQESMQMTSEKFDHLESRIDEVASGVKNLERQMTQVNTRLKTLEDAFEMHDRDIKDILKLLDALNERVALNEKERELAAEMLGRMVVWAQEVSEKIGIPLKLNAS